MASARFSIRVSKDYLKFSAAHFMAHRECREKLHGHNYQVSVRLEGTLGGDGYVIDFGLVKDLGRRLCRELDERTLVPTASDCLEVKQAGEGVEVTYRDGSRFFFPAGDVVLLPIAHTSAEELASWLAERLREELAGEMGRGLELLEVGVAESAGQVAHCCLRLRHSGRPAGSHPQPG